LQLLKFDLGFVAQAAGFLGEEVVVVEAGRFEVSVEGLLELSLR
jgi:hypothetical protein